MGKSKITINYKGIGEVLKSTEVIDLLESKAKQIQMRAGEGYEVTTYIGKSRANVSVKAETKKAKRDNSKNNTLLKAMGGLK